MSFFPSKEIREIIGKAIVDKDYRDHLYTDRPAALSAYDPGYVPTAEDTAILDQIPKDKLEELAQQTPAVVAAIAIVVNAAPPPPPGP